MIDFDEIKQFFPEVQQKSPQLYEYMLKEYFHYKILEIIFNSKPADKLSFIGGSNLRIIHKIRRFSEDLDFDCFNLERKEFIDLTDQVISQLSLEGITVHADDKEKDLQLKAFRRNMVFPGLMYNLNLSNHIEKRFLIKVECEPHHFQYTPDKPVIQKFNVFTQINASPADVLLSMKSGAVLERQKGRDYYDFIFLSGKTTPNYYYLKEKLGIASSEELYISILKSCESVDFRIKSKDFEKLVFDQTEAKKVLLFREFVKQKILNQDLDSLKH
ncbi:MAG: nucleotidyl transferase AbiEii/AbiGii toxin family protein [Bacteroidales bacterium]|nr:nucleotidyl transferase AbiEii/AbiGii toxin family protein [Bacteroidales bacterium]